MIITANVESPVDGGLRHSQPDTVAIVGQENHGAGTLYVAESILTWISNDGRGFSLSYPTISMHAISRDLVSFPHPCVYMAVDSIEPSEDEGQNGSSHADSDDDQDNDSETGAAKSSEIRFAPADPSSLESIYRALCECQALHPDENESISDDEEDEGPYDDAVNWQPSNPSDEFQFDSQGQLVVGVMRGVRSDEDSCMDEDSAPALPQQIEDMETGQFDDAPE